MFDYNSFVGVGERVRRVRRRERLREVGKRVGEKGGVEISGQSPGRAKALLTLRNNY